MKKPIARFGGAALIAIAMAGCGQKAEETTVEAAPIEESATAEAPAGNAPAAAAPVGKEVLPGASSVRESIAKKDYETAVGALLALKGAATQGAPAEEYSALFDEVKFALMDASQTDSKAASALMTLRAAAAGR